MLKRIGRVALIVLLVLVGLYFAVPLVWGMIKWAIAVVLGVLALAGGLVMYIRWRWNRAD